MSTETCRHGNPVPTSMLSRLPESQSGLGRHKCAACAFVQAQNEVAQGQTVQGDMVRCDHGRVAPWSILRSLRDNQGGTGRHKCVVCAYQEGRATERGLALDEAWAPWNERERNSLTAVAGPDGPARDEPEIDPMRKKAIGDLGEALVLEYEKNWLLRIGRTDLANRISHIAVVEGDGAGYDIRSYDATGQEKHIEVKTTTAAADAAFYITENERVFGDANSGSYHIYRVFALDEATLTARFFVLSGAPTEYLSLKPIAYRASLRSDEET